MTDNVREMFDKSVPSLASIKEASGISGYHEEYVRYLIREGKVEGIKMGHSWMVWLPSLDTYLASRGR